MIPADFWKRVAARLIDMLIISVLTIPIVMFYMPKLEPFFLTYQQALTSADIEYTRRAFSALTSEMISVLSPIMLVIETLYFSLQEASRYQATLGKRVLGIKVVNRHGERISLLQSVARTLAKYLSSFIFCIGYLMAAFTRHKQALHDLVTDSFVVNNAKNRQAADADNRTSTFVG